jgi:Raf kinase inhibitor-like YbhB/YbcL family protein
MEDVFLGPMKLISPDFSDGSSIPDRFTCDGENISPTLNVEEVPETAKSLVLIVDDPDAPGGTFTHWLIWNLTSDLAQIMAGNPPSGAVQGTNDFGALRYGGPCPPSGVHRYYFRLYAVDAAPELTPRSKRKAVGAAIKGHIVGEATLMGRYARRGGKH